MISPPSIRRDRLTTSLSTSPLSRTALPTILLLLPIPRRPVIIVPISSHTVATPTATAITSKVIVVAVAHPHVLDALGTLSVVHPAAPLLPCPLPAARKAQPVRQHVRTRVLFDVDVVTVVDVFEGGLAGCALFGVDFDMAHFFLFQGSLFGLVLIFLFSLCMCLYENCSILFLKSFVVTRCIIVEKRKTTQVVMIELWAVFKSETWKETSSSSTRAFWGEPLPRARPQRVSCVTCEAAVWEFLSQTLAAHMRSTLPLKQWMEACKG